MKEGEYTSYNSSMNEAPREMKNIEAENSLQGDQEPPSAHPSESKSISQSWNMTPILRSGIYIEELASLSSHGEWESSNQSDHNSHNIHNEHNKNCKECVELRWIIERAHKLASSLLKVTGEWDNEEWTLCEKLTWLLMKYRLVAEESGRVTGYEGDLHIPAIPNTKRSSLSDHTPNLKVGGQSMQSNLLEGGGGGNTTNTYNNTYNKYKYKNKSTRNISLDKFPSLQLYLREGSGGKPKCRSRVSNLHIPNTTHGKGVSGSMNRTLPLAQYKSTANRNISKEESKASQRSYIKENKSNISAQKTIKGLSRNEESSTDKSTSLTKLSGKANIPRASNTTKCNKLSFKTKEFENQIDNPETLNNQNRVNKMNKECIIGDRERKAAPRSSSVAVRKEINAPLKELTLRESNRNHSLITSTTRGTRVETTKIHIPNDQYAQNKEQKENYLPEYMNMTSRISTSASQRQSKYSMSTKPKSSLSPNISPEEPLHIPPPKETNYEKCKMYGNLGGKYNQEITKATPISKNIGDSSYSPYSSISSSDLALQNNQEKLLDHILLIIRDRGIKQKVVNELDIMEREDIENKQLGLQSLCLSEETDLSTLIQRPTSVEESITIIIKYLIFHGYDIPHTTTLEELLLYVMDHANRSPTGYTNININNARREFSGEITSEHKSGNDEEEEIDLIEAKNGRKSENPKSREEITREWGTGEKISVSEVLDQCTFRESIGNKESENVRIVIKEITSSEPKSPYINSGVNIEEQGSSSPMEDILKLRISAYPKRSEDICSRSRYIYISPKSKEEAEVRTPTMENEIDSEYMDNKSEITLFQATLTPSSNILTPPISCQVSMDNAKSSGRVEFKPKSKRKCTFSEHRGKVNYGEFCGMRGDRLIWREMFFAPKYYNSLPICRGRATGKK